MVAGGGGWTWLSWPGRGSWVGAACRHCPGWLSVCPRLPTSLAAGVGGPQALPHLDMAALGWAVRPGGGTLASPPHCPVRPVLQLSVTQVQMVYGRAVLPLRFTGRPVSLCLSHIQEAFSVPNIQGPVGRLWGAGGCTGCWWAVDTRAASFLAGEGGYPSWGEAPPPPGRRCLYM